MRLMRAHADHLPVVLSAKGRRHGADAVEGPGDVGVEHLAPGVLAEAPQGTVARDPSIVDEEMHAAQALLGLEHELLDRATVAHVAPHRQYAGSHRGESGFGE